MQFSTFQLTELLIRFMALGQLALLFCLVSTKTRFNQTLARVLIACIAGYLIMTISNDALRFTPFRGVFLFLTELLPWVFWLFAYSLVNQTCSPAKWPFWFNSLLCLALGWFAYFFVVLQGQGWFHTFNHLMAIILLVHIIYICAHDLADDLINERRKHRVYLMVYGCIYFISLASIELLNTNIKNSEYFTLFNALLIFISIGLFSIYQLKFIQHIPLITLKNSEEPNINLEQSTPPISDPVSRTFKKQYQTLLELMENGGFKQSNLTVKALALQLAMPEHHLRELINQELGFKNFTTFLNSYRIAAACEAFSDIDNIRIPILTIALDLGYGSIGPFNRAFKEQLGITPSEFRKNI
ncbi:AraC family transcriptional regulator [Pseudoalteromonas tunicata]|uniref:Positive regulator for rhaRS operon, AraC family protein n=1 Tax=Pseudoalteromonas tunicata D2 TaxID=87626 RepID=A4CDL7_9GAMM|nr:helix-turn-helix domain-containing protein [Pseudoalteromonas tunicata]ATC96452.1 hypothetical protein PTUN_a4259 [Pseudoalteromonas tunicata]AXT31934.1 AraC family transcriptional regulator [Pseudoalteromonas tunicata]EAR27059.1 Positive regulator for rhaRS operon, AraC family protein [Pseudoalteromonas tunicata D2]MDP4984566.1 helix-turn-helix domain-containing protein [Pseudoalteromonas tunicata]